MKMKIKNDANLWDLIIIFILLGTAISQVWNHNSNAAYGWFIATGYKIISLLED